MQTVVVKENWLNNFFNLGLSNAEMCVSRSAQELGSEADIAGGQPGKPCFPQEKTPGCRRRGHIHAAPVDLTSHIPWQTRPPGCWAQGRRRERQGVPAVAGSYARNDPTVTQGGHRDVRSRPRRQAVEQHEDFEERRPVSGATASPGT